VNATARLILVVLIAVVLFDPQAVLAAEPAKQPTAIGRDGGAATVDVKGTQAAIDTLRKGGNAVDAAVAAAGVLGVTEPYSCGIGGGGFMVIRMPDGEVTTSDSREESPAAMRPDSFSRTGPRWRSSPPVGAASPRACPGPWPAGSERSTGTEPGR
jgi:gamma-glutamyltranspeptidase